MCTVRISKPVPRSTSVSRQLGAVTHNAGVTPYDINPNNVPLDDSLTVKLCLKVLSKGRLVVVSWMPKEGFGKR